MNSALKNMLRRMRRRVHQSLGHDVRVPVQADCARLFLGTEYGGWCVSPEKLNAQSVVYSFGVGEDISWDLAMIDRFGVTVHAFDPTPKSIAWLKTQDHPPQFQFHDYGIATFDGTAQFTLPGSSNVSFTMAGTPNQEGQPVVSGQVRRLSTIMDELGHRRVDILKMDIEGAENDVIADLETLKLEIDQLLVEFHHRIGNRQEVRQTAEAIDTINRMGFRMFFNSIVGKEFSFIKDSAT